MKSTENQPKEYILYSVNIEIPFNNRSGTSLNNLVHLLKLEEAFRYILSAPEQENGHTQFSAFTVAGICYLLSDSQRILTMII